MLTEQELILKFKQHPELQKRVGILKIASEINPDFKNPHIIGGYLRDLVLGVSPRDRLTATSVYEGEKDKERVAYSLSDYYTNADGERVFGKRTDFKYRGEVLDETRTYDVRYQGMLIWTIFRDRTFYSVLAGVATRGLYLCHKLGLNPSAASEELFRRFEFHFERLEDKDKQARIRYWNKKTKNLKGVEAILEKYDVKSLSF
ncbi:MAG: hypothetical protein UV41_C0004G0014 [Candidatus Daviesbacteria bacterium GW2011_GWA2_42_7]|uniref:Poly A polymerase head domain-containing protein n=1 Tax=Candidatus Daviesbacteria bacterium GW2011_GWA2_42_7 TaxID=1618425 RepID=A0A0G1BCU7_9BACT|nr:MAG: hypothetical protein UV41_C0004G0014 [Candidatus Daviesbacteria bacterium GW2011_GWA2_42_7]